MIDRDPETQDDAIGSSTPREDGFRTLVESFVDAVLIVESSTVTYANTAAATLLGAASSAELVGADVLSHIHPDERAHVAAWVGSGRSSDRYHARTVVRGDGSVRIVESRCVEATFEGRPCRVVVYRDLTDRHQLEALRRRTERLAALGTLAAGVGHEINNPLSFVVANVAFADGEIARSRKAIAAAGAACPQEALGALAEASQALRDAAVGADRVARIVRDLKTLTAAEDERRGPTDVGAAIAHALAVTGHEIRLRARLTEAVPDLPPVEASPGLLAQLFANLLVNAAQALPEGQADRHRVDVVARHDVEAGRVVVEVRDSGAGIEPEVLPRIFDPFFTTRPVGGGTGLGLAISHGIVTALGGQIAVDSRPGVGSSFRVSLPALATPAVAAPGPQAAERRGRVLVVDDEEMFGNAIQRILKREHDVVAVTRGADALARIQAGERFDLVLCDLAMPEMTGMELYERIEALDRTLAARMVFLTGGTLSEAAGDFLERFPGRHHDKPMSAAALRALVRGKVAAPAFEVVGEAG